MLNEIINECAPIEQNDSNEWNEERVVKKVEGWIQPEKFVPINYFFKKHKIKVKHKENGKN